MARVAEFFQVPSATLVMTARPAFRSMVRSNVIAVCAVAFMTDIVLGILNATFSLYVAGLGASFILVSHESVRRHVACGSSASGDHLGPGRRRPSPPRWSGQLRHTLRGWTPGCRIPVVCCSARVERGLFRNRRSAPA